MLHLIILLLGWSLYDADQAETSIVTEDILDA